MYPLAQLFPKQTDLGHFCAGFCFEDGTVKLLEGGVHAPLPPDPTRGQGQLRPINGVQAEYRK